MAIGKTVILVYFTCTFSKAEGGLFTRKEEKVLLFLSMYHSDMHVVRSQSLGGGKVEVITGRFFTCVVI